MGVSAHASDCRPELTPRPYRLVLADHLQSRNMQHATCSMQHATCSRQQAACSMQHATFGLTLSARSPLAIVSSLCAFFSVLACKAALAPRKETPRAEQCTGLQFGLAASYIVGRRLRRYSHSLLRGRSAVVWCTCMLRCRCRMLAWLRSQQTQPHLLSGALRIRTAEECLQRQRSAAQSRRSGPD